MRNSLLLFVFLGLISCQSNSNTQESIVDDMKLENLELVEIYNMDQADRKTDSIDWKVVWKKDSLRQVRVYELLDSNKVITSIDYRNAAMIFQHGRDSISYGMAVKLMRKSIELDSTASKWLLAAAIDRYLLSKGEAQIYGTQYEKNGDEPWKLSRIDTTKISDKERIKYGVETLAEQLETVKKLNKED